MKNLKKFAATAAIIMIIAFIALYTRSNWGSMADKAVNYVAQLVTGTNPQIKIFTEGTNGKATTSDTTGSTW